MKDGFVSVAAASPVLRVADCVRNAGQIADAVNQAVSKKRHKEFTEFNCDHGQPCKK